MNKTIARIFNEPTRHFLYYHYHSLIGFLNFKRISILFNSLMDYSAWIKTMNPDYLGSINNYVPWMNFKVISLLNNHLTKDMSLFEWGSGSSTVYFSQKVKNVVSVEHDKLWYNKTVETIRSYALKNVEYKLREPEDAEFKDKFDRNDPENFASESPDSLTKSFRNYATAIDEYPDASFDVIIVDGRARPSCLHRCLKKLKMNGLIVLDNSERERYLEHFRKCNEYANFHVTDYVGHMPYNYHLSKTTFIKKIS